MDLTNIWKSALSDHSMLGGAAAAVATYTLTGSFFDAALAGFGTYEAASGNLGILGKGALAWAAGDAARESTKGAGWLISEFAGWAATIGTFMEADTVVQALTPKNNTAPAPS